jgi:putative transposase
MDKTKVIQLSEERRQELTDGHRSGASHAFRERCQMILLKSEKRTSSEIARLLGCHKIMVNEWVKRFEAEDIEGLKTRPGRGRRAILQAATDLSQVRAAVERSRQRISLARTELETELQKPFSTATLRRFLKKTIVATNALENG